MHRRPKSVAHLAVAAAAMSRAQANLLLLVSAFLWGMGNVAQKTVLQDIGPITALGFRGLIAALTILPFCLMRSETPQPAGRMPWTSMFMVSALFAAAAGSLQIGMGQTTVTNAGFLVNTTTVITPMLVWILMRQRPGATIWPAALATLAGAYLMSGGMQGAFQPGDLWCLVSAVFYSLWMVALGRFVTRHGNAARLSLVQFALVGACCTGVGYASEGIAPGALVRALPELLLLGVFSTGLGYFFEALAQKHTPACEAAIITSAEAIFGAIAGHALLDERLSLMGAAGAALILSGIVLVQLPECQWLRHRLTRLKPAGIARGHALRVIRAPVTFGLEEIDHEPDFRSLLEYLPSSDPSSARRRGRREHAARVRRPARPPAGFPARRK